MRWARYSAIWAVQTLHLFGHFPSWNGLVWIADDWCFCTIHLVKVFELGYDGYEGCHCSYVFTQLCQFARWMILAYPRISSAEPSDTTVLSWNLRSDTKNVDIEDWADINSRDVFWIFCNLENVFDICLNPLAVSLILWGPINHQQDQQAQRLRQVTILCRCQAGPLLRHESAIIHTCNFCRWNSFNNSPIESHRHDIWEYNDMMTYDDIATWSFAMSCHVLTRFGTFSLADCTGGPVIAPYTPAPGGPAPRPPPFVPGGNLGGHIKRSRDGGGTICVWNECNMVVICGRFWAWRSWKDTPLRLRWTAAIAEKRVGC